MKSLSFRFVLLPGLAIMAVIAPTLIPISAFAAETTHRMDAATTGNTLGSVHFENSCKSKSADGLNRAIALMHSFEYPESGDQFRDVAQHDKKCAIAQWGIAMSLYHQLWDYPDEAAVKQALAALDLVSSKKMKTTPREQDYLDAIRTYYTDADHLESLARATEYSKKMASLVAQYPDDHEAAAFYALSLLGSEPPHDATFANRHKAAAILEPLFAANPDHPGLAHYLIHTYDKPALAAAGLPAALRYAQIAPSSPHAVHMPSHIFERLGMWQADIDSNLASVAATRHSVEMHMGGGGHQLHALDYLSYAYLQVGREADARQIVADLPTMPGLKEAQIASSRATYSARIALELHDWTQAAQVPIPTSAPPLVQATVSQAHAIAAARSGNLDAARHAVEEMESNHKQLEDLKEKYSADDVRLLLQEAQAWTLLADHKSVEARAMMRTAAETEEAEGPEQTAIPAREMLAEMLLQLHQPAAALTAFERALKDNPGRFNALYGAAQAAQQSGQHDASMHYYAKLIEQCDAAATISASASKSSRPELAVARQAIRQAQSGTNLP